jgi:signal peptidase I
MTRWRLTAGLCSALLPGTGQFLLNQRTRAIMFWILLAVLLVLWIPLRLPNTFPGLLTALALTLVLWLASVHDALLGFRHSGHAPRALWLAVLLPIALVVALFDSVIFFHLAGFHTLKIASNGMEPTIRAGERIVVSNRTFHPEQGDIIYFRRYGTVPVKRVIGLSGNMVQGTNGAVQVNGTTLNEPYAQHTGPHLPNLDNFGPVSVPQGSLFVMGDNRDVSLDSRMADFGTVAESEIAGRPVYIGVSSNPLRIGKQIR